MLSETIVNGLGSYKIGPKIRALRTSKEMGLVQLGQNTGLSPALLSKIERGQLFPTLPTLLRIALVFGVGLEHFFVEIGRHAQFAIVRKKERLRFPSKPGEDPPSYVFESLDFPVTERKMQAYYAEFRASSKPSEEHTHAGAEIIYVLSGQLSLSLDGAENLLEEGDAMYFESHVTHSYKRHGRAACAAIVVVTA